MGVQQKEYLYVEKPTVISEESLIFLEELGKPSCLQRITNKMRRFTIYLFL